MQVGILAFMILIFAIMIVSGTFIATHIFRTFRRVGEMQDSILQSSAKQPSREEPAKLKTPAGDVLRCKQCGAVVDSTSELSAEGAIRCNYCNTWTSIYSPGGGNAS